MKIKLYQQILLTFSLIMLSISVVKAFDLDMTVDDDIRSNYNSSKLIKDTHTDELETLPALPDKLKSNTTNISNKNTQINTKPITNINDIHAGNTKIHKGTIFHVTNNSQISDSLIPGTTVKFKLNSPVIKNKYTIPKDAIFTGEITESHQPQVSCNGGLVVIKINSMNYKSQTIPINAYITKADNKFVFLNNIKGERTYLKTMWQKGAWGRSMFHRMCSLSAKLGSDGATLVLAPFSFGYGVLCAGGNAIITPVTAFFSKGKHVSIQSGSNFNIRLLDDAYVN